MKSFVLGFLLAATMPTQAEGIEYEAVHPNGDTLYLYNEPGMCMGSAKLAMYVTKDDLKIPGCFLINQGLGMVRVVFLDGDILEAPIAVFKQATKAGKD